MIGGVASNVTPVSFLTREDLKGRSAKCVYLSPDRVVWLEAEILMICPSFFGFRHEPGMITPTA
jgi:hypothetical protein